MSQIEKRPAIHRDANPDKIIRDLERHLLDSFSHLESGNKSAVLFSGGVDSSLAALLTKQHCKDTLLITARCEDSHDASVSKKAAKTMSLDFAEVTIDSESVWEVIPDIMRTIKKTDKMNVEIAIPFFLAAREAHRLGFEIMVSGQGPDELFGGYARYERMFIEDGSEAVEAALWNDYSVTDEANIQRDRKVIEYHNLKPFFPYLHPEFVACALSIPAEMNIDPKKKPARKLMFRKLASAMGVPEHVAMEQKRATQYSSGTSKMLVQSMMEHIPTLGSHSKRSVEVHMDEILEKINRQQSEEE